jgi:hypothetical protein
MHHLCVGTMHSMRNCLHGLFVGSLETQKYTLGEKLGLWRGKFSSGVTPLLGEVTMVTRRGAWLTFVVQLQHGESDRRQDPAGD